MTEDCNISPMDRLVQAFDFWSEKAEVGSWVTWPDRPCKQMGCGVTVEGFVSSINVLGADYVDFRHDAAADPDKSMIPYVCGRRAYLISLRAFSVDVLDCSDPLQILEKYQATAQDWTITQQLRAWGFVSVTPQGDIRRLDIRSGDSVSTRASMEIRLRHAFTLRGCAVPRIDGVTVTSQLSLPDGTFPAVNISSKDLTS